MKKSPLYRIRNWADYFENNRTKELKRMAWVPMPVKHDGDGYTSLVDHENGAAHFGIWCFLVELAAKCNPRGTLIRESEIPQEGAGIPQEGATAPHDPASMSRISRMKVRDFEDAIPRLLQIGWLEEVTTIPQEGAGIPQEPAALRARAGGNGTERNGTTENGTTGPDSSESSFEIGEKTAAGPDPAKRLALEAGIELRVGPKQVGQLQRLISISGYAPALSALQEAIAKGIGAPANISYAEQILAGNKAKSALTSAANGKAARPLDRPKINQV